LLAALFGLFWTCPIRLTFELPSHRLRRVAAVSTGLSVLLGTASLMAYGLPSNKELFDELSPYAFAVLGLSYYFMFVPFLLTQSADDFTLFFQLRERKQAILIYWYLMAGLLLGSIVACFFVWILPQDFQAWQHHAEAVFVFPFGLGLCFRVWIIRGLEKALARVPGFRLHKGAP
jgi:hypothetical protein